MPRPLSSLAAALLVAALPASAQEEKSDPRCAPGRASELLEAGRKLQREKGEGGANEAIAKYRGALKADPKCAAALWEMGWSQQLKGDWEANIASWDKLRKLAPDYPELEEQYAAALRRRDEVGALKRLPPPGKAPERELAPAEGEPITFTAVGDVHMGMAWPEERAVLPPDDGADLFQSVTALIKEGDFAFGNLETVLADSGDSKKCGKRSTKCFAFRVPTSFGKALKEAGFTVMSIANNHAGDFGPEGRRATMEALDQVGILHSGPIGDLASWETKGRKIALVAFSTGADVYRLQETETARRVVADLKRKHDLVIVSFHGGAEGDAAQNVPRGREVFYGEDRGDLRAFVRAVIDSGADVVLGHGPHVLRGAEIYKGRLVLYSMGNFSSFRTFGLGGAKGVTGLFKVTIAPNGVVTALEVKPLVIEEPGRPKPDAERRAIATLRRLSTEDFGEPLLDEAGAWARPAGGAAGR